MHELCMVVKARTDVAIIRALLPRPTDRRFRYFAGEGRIGLSTIGRNILVHEGNPVLVVMDALTFDPETAWEKVGMARMALRRFSSEDYSDAFAFLPEIEVVFFEAAPILLRRGIEPARIERGLDRPRLILGEELERLGETFDGFLKGLTEEDIEALRRGPQAGRFLDVVERLVSSSGREELARATSAGPG
jgi:hypothetical protein